MQQPEPKRDTATMADHGQPGDPSATPTPAQRTPSTQEMQLTSWGKERAATDGLIGQMGKAAATLATQQLYALTTQQLEAERLAVDAELASRQEAFDKASTELGLARADIRAIEASAEVCKAKMAEAGAVAAMYKADTELKLKAITEKAAKDKAALQAEMAKLEELNDKLQLGTHADPNRIDPGTRMTIPMLMGDKNGELLIATKHDKQRSLDIKEITRMVEQQMRDDSEIPNNWQRHLDDDNGAVLNALIKRVSQQLNATADGAGSVDAEKNEYSKSLIEILEQRLGEHLSQWDITALQKVANAIVPVELVTELESEVGRHDPAEALMVLWHRAYGGTPTAFQGICTRLGELIDSSKIEGRKWENPIPMLKAIDDVTKDLFATAGGGLDAMKAALYRVAISKDVYKEYLGNLDTNKHQTSDELRRGLYSVWKAKTVAHAAVTAARKARPKNPDTPPRPRERVGGKREREQAAAREKARAAATTTDDGGDKKAKNECYSCKQEKGYDGHASSKCPHKICNYCEQKGHIKWHCPKFKAENKKSDAAKDGAAGGKPSGAAGMQLAK